MKTQQEIEEKAEREYPTPITGLDYLDLRKGFIKGYQAANEDKKELLEALKDIVKDSIANDFNEHWDSFKKTKEQQTDFKVGDMVRCVDDWNSDSKLIKGNVYEVSEVEEDYIGLKSINDEYCVWKKSRFELVSTTEKEPVYGQEVYTKDYDRGKNPPYIPAIYIDKVESCYRLTLDVEDFKKGYGFKVGRYGTMEINPKIIKLTLKEIAEKYGVDSIEIINE